MKEKLKKLSMVAIPMGTVLAGSSAFAEGTATTTSESITASLTTIANDITSTIGAIAPIAMGVAGLFLAWRYGMKFFKSVSK